MTFAIAEKSFAILLTSRFCKFLKIKNLVLGLGTENLDVS